MPGGCKNHQDGHCKHNHPINLNSTARIPHAPPSQAPPSPPLSITPSPTQRLPQPRQQQRIRGAPPKGPPYVVPNTTPTAQSARTSSAKRPAAADYEDGEELPTGFATAGQILVSHSITHSTLILQPTNTAPIAVIETTKALRPLKRRRFHRVDPADHRLVLLRMLCRNLTNIGVHVLHDCLVSEEEMIVLSLGLNFCPPPRKHKSILLFDAVEQFTRQVRIKKHFASLQLDSTPDFSIEQRLHLRINKSLSLDEARLQFEPSVTHSPIESYLNTLRNTLCPLSDTTSQPTLTPTWKAYYNFIKQLGS